MDPSSSGNRTISLRLPKVLHRTSNNTQHSLTSEIHRSSRSKWRFSLLSRLFPVLSTPAHTLPLTTVSGNEDPLTTTTQHITQTVSSLPRWSAKRADPVLDVTFVNSFDHTDMVRAVRFSPDGKYLAAATRDNTERNGTIIIYDVETRKKTCVLVQYHSQYSSEERPGIICVCFSPDGRYLVVGDTAFCVTVWDIPKKRIRNAFRGHGSYVESVDFSPNGRLVVSASWDRTVRIWNVRDGSAKAFTDDAPIRAATFSPNGQSVVAGNTDGVLTIWDVRTGRVVKRWSGHKDALWSVAFTPDGKGLVSGSNDGVMKCWDVGSRGVVQSSGGPVATEIMEYKGHTKDVRTIAISPNGQWVASGSEDKTGIIWDARSATPQFTLIGHEGAVSSVNFSPVENYLALGSYDRHITLWRYTRI